MTNAFDHAVTTIDCSVLQMSTFRDRAVPVVAQAAGF